MKNHIRVRTCWKLTVQAKTCRDLPQMLDDHTRIKNKGLY